MSNYGFIVHAWRHTRRVDAWLSRWAGSGDIAKFRLGLNRLVIISRDAETSTRGSIFMRGTAVAPDHDALVFGIEGWLQAPESLRSTPGSAGGEYVVGDWTSGRLRLDTDLFGGARLAYTQGSGFLAASDSLLVLMSLRRALGQRNLLDHEVATARTAKNAVAGQQMSPDTLITDIRYVPAGRGLTQTGPLLGWSLTGAPIGDVIEDHQHGREALREAASDVSRTVLALASVPTWHTRLSLSGGQDSRVVLAALLAGKNTHGFSVNTAPRTAATAADYDVVMRLAERYGLELYPQNPTAEAPDPDAALTLWGASVMGLYDGFGAIIAHRSLIRTFALTGIGAEIYKGNWDWSDLNTLADRVAPQGDVHDAVVAQLTKAASSVNVDPIASNASELVYLGYRNGIHGSAGHIGIHMTGVNPIMQMPLAAAAHTRTSDGFAGSPSGMTDLTLLLHPELALEPHEDPRRDITRAEAESRLVSLGGPLEHPEPLRVYGDPARIPDGPSHLSMNLSASLGISGVVNTENAMSDVDERVAGVSDPALRALYVDMLANARWRLNKADGDLRAAGVQPARLRGLALLQLVDQ